MNNVLGVKINKHHLVLKYHQFIRICVRVVL